MISKDQIWKDAGFKPLVRAKEIEDFLKSESFLAQSQAQLQDNTANQGKDDQRWGEPVRIRKIWAKKNRG